MNTPLERGDGSPEGAALDASSERVLTVTARRAREGARTLVHECDVEQNEQTQQEPLRGRRAVRTRASEQVVSHVWAMVSLAPARSLDTGASGSASAACCRRRSIGVHRLASRSIAR